MGRWLALGAYTALVYGLLPYGPRLGRGLQASEAGRWVLGPGMPWMATLGVLALAVRLRRRDAGAAAYAVLVATAVGAALGLAWLHAVRLERVHLPEYAIAACLAWRALQPRVGDGPLGYLAAAVVAAMIGWGDELVQAVTPGRFYDLRDVAANALGAGLGAGALAAWRAKGA